GPQALGEGGACGHLERVERRQVLLLPGDAGPHHGLGVVEVAEHRAHGDARPGRHLLDRGLEPALPVQLEQRGDDGVAVALPPPGATVDRRGGGCRRGRSAHAGDPKLLTWQLTILTVPAWRRPRTAAWRSTPSGGACGRCTRSTPTPWRRWGPSTSTTSSGPASCPSPSRCSTTRTC